jgi:hypothetical protein
MFIIKFFKSKKIIILLGILVAITPLMLVPSYFRDVAIYCLGILIAVRAYFAFRRVEMPSTLEESFVESSKMIDETVGIYNSSVI